MKYLSHTPEGLQRWRIGGVPFPSSPAPKPKNQQRDVLYVLEQFRTVARPKAFDTEKAKLVIVRGLRTAAQYANHSMGRVHFTCQFYIILLYSGSTAVHSLRILSRSHQL